MFKRILCAMLVAVMIVAGCAAMAAEGSFQSVFTVGVDNDAAAWTQNSERRALLTWCILMDYTNAGYDMTKIDLDGHSSYVSVSGNLLALAASTDDGHPIIFVYQVGDPEILFQSDETTGYSESAMENALASSSDAYYKNSDSALAEVAEMLIGAVNG